MPPAPPTSATSSPADLEERCGDTPGNAAHFLKIGAGGGEWWR
jgi:hypothetical protein